MRRSQIASLVGIVVLAVGGVITAAVADWRPLLGLDLQGGLEIVLEPAETAGDVSDEELDQAIEILRNRVDAIGVAEPDITRQGQTIVVQLPGIEDIERARALIGQTAELRFRPVSQFLPGGFDLSDPQARATAASIFDLTANPDALLDTDPTVSAEAVDPVTATTAPGSADDTETSDAPTTVAPTTAAPTTAAPTTAAPTTTAAEGDSSAGSATLAAPDDVVAQDDDTTTTSEPAEETTTTAAETTTTTEPTTTTAADGESDETTTTFLPTTVAPTTTEFDPATAPSVEELLTAPEDDLFERPVILRDFFIEDRAWILEPAELTGDTVDSASADFVNSWVINLSFTGEGSAQFDDLAQRNFQRQVAIVLDGVVYSAPTINAVDFGGQAVISGAFSEDEAKDVALALRFGALPVEFEEQAARNVSATLGQDALDAGIVAGIVGLILVTAYMLFYYRLLGLVALLSLAVSGALLWTIIAYIGDSRGLALTLAGATGIIVSIGVQADSNIVYYERLKDEVRRGRSIRSAADGSFRGAYSTIIKADVASLIGALLLYSLSVGAVRGFALFLGITTVLDLIVSYFFMRPLVVAMGRSRLARNPRVLGLIEPDDEAAEAPSPAVEVS